MATETIATSRANMRRAHAATATIAHDEQHEIAHARAGEVLHVPVAVIQQLIAVVDHPGGLRIRAVLPAAEAAHPGRGRAADGSCPW